MCNNNQQGDNTLLCHGKIKLLDGLDRTCKNKTQKHNSQVGNNSHVTTVVQQDLKQSITY